MSDNPFNSPSSSGVPPNDGVPMGTASLPGLALAIAIIGLLLGVLSLFGNCCAGGGTFMMSNQSVQDSIQKVMDDAAAKDPNQAKAAEDFRNQMKLARENIGSPLKLGVLICQIVVGILLGVLLLIGSIGVLRRKEFGRKVMVAACVLGMVLIIANVAIGFAMGTFGNGMADLPDEQKMIAMITLVVTGLFSLFCLVYYIVGWRYLAAPERRGYFS